VAALLGADEQDTLALTRRLHSYLPDAFDEPGMRREGCQDPQTDPGAIVPADPRHTYDVRRVAAAILDEGTFLELRGGFAPNLVTGLGRLEGATVGVIANQPQTLAGAIDIAASRKGARFVELCDRFGFPLCVLVDTPGFLPGTAQELGGVIPAGAEFLAAFVRAGVPKATVVLRKAYGGAYIVMNARDLGADYTYAWPQAEVAVLGPRGAVRILERKRLAEAPDPEALRVRLEAEYRERYCSPWPAARAGYIDEVIDPTETRARLAAALVR
jgi:acetyl-CoA carboxylase carboxyltransferase component